MAADSFDDLVAAAVERHLARRAQATPGSRRVHLWDATLSGPRGATDRAVQALRQAGFTTHVVDCPYGDTTGPLTDPGGAVVESDPDRRKRVHAEAAKGWLRVEMLADKPFSASDQQDLLDRMLSAVEATRFELRAHGVGSSARSGGEH